jgi:adenine-specific DNA-methyltransferase
MLSEDIVEGDEAYEFTWVGKKAAIVKANKPIRKTLRPCPEESKDWDNTENLYIEGDNLEVLKLLQESYLGKVKMIYIDPPYNTGNDFIYRDDFKQSADEYDEDSGVYDEETGDRLFKNTDSNGRFHSDWCSMIYSPLLLSRNLLSDNGVIFISIDDREENTLRMICDEVFGNGNFVGCIILQTATDNNPRQINTEHEYVLCYARNKSSLTPWAAPSEKAQKIQEKYLELKISMVEILLLFKLI